ncbi:MATE family efflux transporter [Peptostreptococcus porci]|uniref:MATE family efflux transporter n=1 Tax=Peptostreptococcus porci TaxID=2652282 RepID=UPI002A91DD42|nr:MATE family efflux transporter [Peptostreptococcus porci]MDY5435787.1 MATE family efflux transporter [Peptostreptococcus porci]
MSNRTEKEFILEDNMWKVCLRLSLPAVIAMFLYGLNTICDMFFIGRYVGEVAFAGVSIVSPLTQIPLGLGSLVGVGAGSYLSVLIGQNNTNIQKRLLGNSNTIMLFFAVISMTLGFLFLNPLLSVMGASGQELQFGSSYFKVTLVGSIFWIGGLAYNMIVRAEGKMKTAAIMMGIGMIINILSNYVFMAILNMGVEGAAWGTNIAMLAYVVLFLAYCKRGSASFETNEYKLYYDKKIIKEIVSLGIPSFIMTIMTVIQGVIILKALNTYGNTTDVAFYGIAFRIMNLLMTPIYGLMRALQPAAGINYGAKQYHRVIGFYKVFSLVAFVLVLPLWLPSVLFPNEIIHMMMPDASFGVERVRYFRFILSIVPLLCIVLTAMTFWPAINKPKPAMLIGIGRQLVLYIPLMIILPKIFGVPSIYYGSFAIDFLLTFIIVIMIKNEFKELRNLHNHVLN